MHPTEAKILGIFAKQPFRDFSTTELVKSVFLVEHEQIMKLFEKQDLEWQKLAKRQKARLHRKLLYHLNKLENDKILKVTRIQGKGEKYFVLNHEKELESKKDKVIKTLFDNISREEKTENLSGLEIYEENGILKRYDEQSWTTKLNAILLDLRDKTLKDLEEELAISYSLCDDVIGIYGFERLIEQFGAEKTILTIKKIQLESEEYNKQINLIINLSKINHIVNISDFIISYSILKAKNIHIIFQAMPEDLKSNLRLQRQIITHFKKEKIRINIHKSNKQPLLIGRAGVYVITKDDWEEYNLYKGSIIGLCFAENSLVVDMYRFFRKEKKSYTEFREFILKVARSLLRTTATLRKQSDATFQSINTINSPKQSKFFLFSKNYIRLWNYDFEVIPYDDFIALLQTTKEQLQEFCKVEETIFKSCGIPINLNINLASSFKKFNEHWLSPRRYKKYTIRNKKELKSEAIIKNIKQREEIVRIFNGADRLRFFRNEESQAQEILEELIELLQNYDLPLISYDFKSRQGELTLDNFM